MKIANVILGSYINGYSIIQELHENGVNNIFVFDIVKDVSARSNKIKGFFLIKNNKESILKSLMDLRKDYHYLILYPNQDIFVQHLCNLYPEINKFCFTAFNPDNAIKYQNKLIQYEYCAKLNVPCPNTIPINTSADLELLQNLSLPILIKPTARDNLKNDVFRTKQLNSKDEVLQISTVLNQYIKNSFQFIASEIIPGNGSNIYAYTGYRKSDGTIVGEWIGKKLSQFPDDFGVFSSASNQAPSILLDQGRRLLNGMNLWGINEAEYKYDHRDGKYKLMEINLRPMMWHRVGALAGVPLNYIQYLDAINQSIPKYEQEQGLNIHYVYLNHELINLITRKNYFRIFWDNLFGGDKRIFALWDIKDPLPFFYSFGGIIRRVMRRIRYKKNDST